jgi:hypothetical protein
MGDFDGLTPLVRENAPIAVVPVKVAEERVRDEHIPKELPKPVGRQQGLFLNRLQNRGQICAVAVLPAVNASVFLVGEFKRTVFLLRKRLTPAFEPDIIMISNKYQSHLYGG